jgi:hypothetical protein
VIRPRSALIRRLFVASTVVTTTACSTLHVEEGPSPRTRVLPSGKGDEILLKLKNGSEVRMFFPIIAGDSVVGVTERTLDPSAPNIAVAKADIETVSVWRTDNGLTTLAVIGGTAAALSFVVLATCASLVAGS